MSSLGVLLIAVALVERVDLSVSPRDFSDEFDHLEATAEEQLSGLRSTARE